MLKMLGNVLKNLFSRPATRKHPFVKREPFKDARGSITFDESKCVYCGLCARRCPAAAINVDRNTKTLTFEHFNCIICDYCIEGCPKDAIKKIECYRAPGYTKSNESIHGEVAPKPSEPVA